MRFPGHQIVDNRRCAAASRSVPASRRPAVDTNGTPLRTTWPTPSSRGSPSGPTTRSGSRSSSRRRTCGRGRTSWRRSPTDLPLLRRALRGQGQHRRRRPARPPRPALPSPTGRTSDAGSVARLLAAGAIVVGKTNLDQFATGLNGTRSPYGAPRERVRRRPDLRRVELGQRGRGRGRRSSRSRSAPTPPGSGRVPAAMNGIVGLKPTRGLVGTRRRASRPAARWTASASSPATSPTRAAVLAVLAGPDPDDPWSRTPRDLDAPAPAPARRPRRPRSTSRATPRWPPPSPRWCRASRRGPESMMHVAVSAARGGRPALHRAVGRRAARRPRGLPARAPRRRAPGRPRGGRARRRLHRRRHLPRPAPPPGAARLAAPGSSRARTSCCCRRCPRRSPAPSSPRSPWPATSCSAATRSPPTCSTSPRSPFPPAPRRTGGRSPSPCSPRPIGFTLVGPSSHPLRRRAVPHPMIAADPRTAA